MRSTGTSLPDNELNTQWRSGMTRAYIDENIDSLRRRADALLDEMMLGGVDIGAGDGAIDVSQADSAEIGYVNGFTDRTHHPGADGGSAFENNAHGTPWSESIYDERPANAGAGRVTDVAPSAGFPPVSAPTHAANALSSLADMEEDGVGSVSAEPAPNIASNRTGRLIPAEQRYARPSVAESATFDAALSEAPTRSPSSAVRRQSAALASSMTVGARANARSTLLPRAVETDVETAEQEIHALLSEIAATLPVGHEAAERGRHLLNKAQHILESDPSRTAEVDYYLQQVRRIVQRTRQMHNDSSLYRRRLTIYLTAWTALAVTSLAARYILQPELLAFLETLFWTESDLVFVQFTPMAVGAFFAGALGAAVGVLTNMQRHAAQEHGYFDRKYGLRGLLLPLLGAIFGLMLAAIWATVCYFMGWNATDLWIGSLPAAVALVLGFAQEWLYGAR